MRCDWEWVQLVLQKVRVSAEVGHGSPLNDLVVNDKSYQSASALPKPDSSEQTSRAGCAFRLRDGHLSHAGDDLAVERLAKMFAVVSGSARAARSRFDAGVPRARSQIAQRRTTPAGRFAGSAERRIGAPRNWLQMAWLRRKATDLGMHCSALTDAIVGVVAEGEGE